MPPPPSPIIFAPNFLEAYRASIGTDFIVGALSVFIWDVLYNLWADYQIIRLHGINFPTMVYFLSRVSTLGFTLMGAIVISMPVKDCHSFQQGILALYVILISSTMLLSYFRVCAVWAKNYYIIGIYLLLWLTGVAGSLTVFSGLPFTHLEGSPYCLEFVLHGFVAAAVFAPTINHVLVFFAIAYGVCKAHILATHQKLSISSSYRVFFFGDSLPAFSKTMLQASQLCYLVAVLSGTTAVIWFYVYASDPNYRLAIFVPYAVIVNIMFSWVFRSAKLTSGTMPNGVPSPAVNPYPTAMQTRRNEFEMTRTDNSEGLSRYPSLPIQIEVNRVVDLKGDMTPDGHSERKPTGTVDYIKFGTGSVE
ncbi:hypothetical protein JR316_0012126 [Psilocybe cubensis]|uniref:Uncharacterized protein n=2 Tax=Psilocybe cubensis TaxID=181762 RepID=A0ACB8GIY3_PSICU|nr:hypothetical protein JR316_0012126 [Psilocybe cubensis]KAH9475025.1 hypothetical protein JR316_0012126 [Psilocybe cubensis]